jgi:hypothetical protein
MDNNIYYKIEEFDNDNDNNDNNDNNGNNNNNNDYNIKNLIYNEEKIIDEYEYNELPIKNINLICDYYKIKRGKLSKKQKIIEIIFFENNMNNIDIVENRKLLWEYVKIVKTDKFLKNHILLDI